VADIRRGLRKIDLEGIDLVAANRMTRQALVAVSEHRLGYAVVCAPKPKYGGRDINQPDLAD
jgi:hypothetical protein